MPKKIFVLPQMKAEINVSSEVDAKEVNIVLAGGRAPESKWLKALISNYPCSKIYCADKGADYCLGNNIHVDLVLGDGDSSSQGSFAKAESLGAKVFTYPTDKDDTDLQLVLKALPSGDILVSGIWGGRFDHLYSNVFSLVKVLEEKAELVIMADQEEVMFLLKAGKNVNIEISDCKNIEAISILPLTVNTSVTLDNVHWPLKNTDLNIYFPYAISNRLENSNFNCSCHQGCFGLYFKFR